MDFKRVSWTVRAVYQYQLLCLAVKQMFIYDLKYLGTLDYDGDNLCYQPGRIMIENEAASCIATYNKNTAENGHLARHFHHAR